MEKFKETYWTICMVIALLITFVITGVNAIQTPGIVAKINNPITETDYQILKDYANTYAKTFDLEDLRLDDITVSSTLNENHIEITVEEVRCKVIATYPVVFEFKSDGEFKTIVAYEEGEYEEVSKLPSTIAVIFSIIIFAFIFWCLSLATIYYPVIWIISLILIIEKGIEKNNEDNK